MSALTYGSERAEIWVGIGTSIEAEIVPCSKNVKLVLPIVNLWPSETASSGCSFLYETSVAWPSLRLSIALLSSTWLMMLY